MHRHEIQKLIKQKCVLRCFLKTFKFSYSRKAFSYCIQLATLWLDKRWLKMNSCSWQKYTTRLLLLLSFKVIILSVGYYYLRQNNHFIRKHNQVKLERSEAQQTQEEMIKGYQLSLITQNKFNVALFPHFNFILV